jgi:hypothetical protein
MAWDNPDDYAYLNTDTSHAQWAWEFIRRNKIYIEEWDKKFSEWENSKERLHFENFVQRSGARLLPHIPNFLYPSAPDFALKADKPNRWKLRYLPRPCEKLPKKLLFNLIGIFEWPSYSAA